MSKIEKSIYEQERDEFIENLPDKPYALYRIADWCKSRFDKIVAEKNLDLNKLIQRNNEWVDSDKILRSKITSAHEMIEKLKKLIVAAEEECRNTSILNRNFLLCAINEAKHELTEWEQANK